MDDLLREFLIETSENLAQLDAELVKFEQTPGDPALLGNIFRLFHTIKGTCAFLDLPRLGRLAHAAENVLGKFRDGKLPVGPHAVSLILRSVDAIRNLLVHLERDGAEPPGSDYDVIAALDAMAEGRTEAPASAAFSGDEYGAGESAVAGQSVRVGIDLLETLMTTVGELVLTRNQLLQILRSREETAFAAPLQRLNQVTSELQESVIRARMQPIGNAWSKLPRIVRDLAVELGKKIDLQMRGAETELDRQVLELIKDPLMHMVRNSGDHGIEPPEERVRAGKPETGTIRLNARHEGGTIVVEVSDDGRGLAIDRIKARALQGGLATEAELAGMPDRQVMQLIFRPGFSTAARVTAVSGRGVGMDVVKTNVEKIGGTIDIQSTPGKGSRFHIKIPLTLAIMPALIIACGGERFAVPQIGVLELVQASPASGHRIETINGAPVLRLRNRLLPLISLHDRLGLGGGEITPDSSAFVVVAQAAGAIFGVIADRVLDTEEIVVKPVSSILRRIDIFSGNTVMGDGSIIMILDLNSLAAGIDRADADDDRRDDRAAPAAKDENRQSLLLFHAGGEAQKAVPLPAVARLEQIDRHAIEYSGGMPMIQYRGRLMPLAPVGARTRMEPAGMQPIVVLAEHSRNMGLIVDRIVDIVEERAQIDFSTGRPGLLGTSIIAGKATDILDAAYYLGEAYRGGSDAAGDAAEFNPGMPFVPPWQIAGANGKETRP